MIKVDTPPEYLCRITRPDLIEIDDEGNFLPHYRNYMDSYGKSVPLVHPDELNVVLNFFYNDVWKSSDFPHFVLLTFFGNKLTQLGKHEAIALLKKHGEHFAIVNVSAIKSAQLCEISGDRASKIFTYSVIYDEYPIRK